jgi:hypothetical protein
MKYLTFIVIIVLASCESKTAESCQGLNCDLVGEWDWTRSYGSIAGQTWTPMSTGEERQLIVDDTSFSLYTDGSLTDIFEYEIFESDTMFSDTIMRTFITYNMNTRWLKYEGDNMEMWDLCFDCYEDYYTRAD